MADRDNAVAFGSDGALRQLTYVAAGTADTDAVNVLQLRSIATALGAGSVVGDDGTLGGAFSGNEKSVSAGAGFSW